MPLLSYQSQTLREREKFCHFTLSHPQAEGGRGWSDKSWLFAIPYVCPGLWGHSKAPGQRGSTSSLCLQGPFRVFSPRAEPPPAPSHIDLAGEPSGVNAKMSWMWQKEETHNFSKIFIEQGNRFLFLLWPEFMEQISCGGSYQTTPPKTFSQAVTLGTALHLMHFLHRAL